MTSPPPHRCSPAAYSARNQQRLQQSHFERSLIVERTSTGRIAAKARGVRFGPKPSLSAEQIAHARQLVEKEDRPVSEVAKLLGVHRATLYRALGATPTKDALAKLVEGITPKNVHEEVSFGPPVGLELI